MSPGIAPSAATPSGRRPTWPSTPAEFLLPSSAATSSSSYTFGGSAKLKATSVSVLGFRAPLGAFIAAWGGIAMITAAPFDNWWHAAYGLDVKIVSPPHTLLILGIRASASAYSSSSSPR